MSALIFLCPICLSNYSEIYPQYCTILNTNQNLPKTKIVVLENTKTINNLGKINVWVIIV